MNNNQTSSEEEVETPVRLPNVTVPSDARERLASERTLDANVAAGRLISQQPNMDSPPRVPLCPASSKLEANETNETTIEQEPVGAPAPPRWGVWARSARALEEDMMASIASEEDDDVPVLAPSTEGSLPPDEELYRLLDFFPQDFPESEGAGSDVDDASSVATYSSYDTASGDNLVSESKEDNFDRRFWQWQPPPPGFPSVAARFLADGSANHVVRAPPAMPGGGGDPWPDAPGGSNNNSNGDPGEGYMATSMAYVNSMWHGLSRRSTYAHALSAALQVPGDLYTAIAAMGGQTRRRRPQLSWWRRRAAGSQAGPPTIDDGDYRAHRLVAEALPHIARLFPDLEEGLLCCVICAQLFPIDRSGPHHGSGLHGDFCSCGAEIVGRGDHITGRQALVLRRGSGWRPTRYTRTGPPLVINRFVGEHLLITIMPSRWVVPPPPPGPARAWLAVPPETRERSRCGDGGLRRNWACGTRGPLADIMWDCHTMTGIALNSGCTHSRWPTPLAAWVHGPEGPTIAGGVLRETEPHFGLRCSACSGWCQHGWLTSAVRIAGNPPPSPREFEYGMMAFARRLTRALEEAPPGLLYVTGSGARYERAEAERDTGLDSLITSAPFIVIVPYGEGPLVQERMEGSGLHVAGMVEAPANFPMRAFGSLRLLALYANRSGSTTVIVNRFTTADHAWSVGAAARVASEHPGKIVCANTYGVAYANMAATAFQDVIVEWSTEKMIDSLCAAGAIYGHDEVIIPFLGPLIVAIDPFCPLTYSSRLRYGQSPYGGIKVRLLPVTVFPFGSGGATPTPLTGREFTATYRKIATAAAARGSAKVKEVFVVGHSSLVTRAALKETRRISGAAKCIWSPPYGLGPGAAAVLAGATPTSTVVAIVDREHPDARRDSLARIARALWAGIVPLNTVTTITVWGPTKGWHSQSWNPFSRFSLRWPSVNRAIYMALGVAWIVGSIIVGGRLRLPPGPAGVAAIRVLGSPTWSWTSAFCWCIVALYDQVAMIQAGSFTWRQSAVRLGVQCVETFTSPMCLGIVWVTNDFTLGCLIYRCAKMLVSMLVWGLSYGEARLGPAPVTDTVRLEFKMVRFRELNNHLPDIGYSWHPRIRVGSRSYEGRFATDNWGLGSPFVVDWGRADDWPKCLSFAVSGDFVLPAEGARFPLVYGPHANCQTGLSPVLASQRHCIEPRALALMWVSMASLRVVQCLMWAIDLGTTAVGVSFGAASSFSKKIAISRHWRSALAASRTMGLATAASRYTTGLAWRSPETALTGLEADDIIDFQPAAVSSSEAAAVALAFAERDAVTANTSRGPDAWRCVDGRWAVLQDSLVPPIGLPSATFTQQVRLRRGRSWISEPAVLARLLEVVAGVQIDTLRVWTANLGNQLEHAADNARSRPADIMATLHTVRSAFPAWMTAGYCNPAVVPTFDNGGICHHHACTGISSRGPAGERLRYPTEAPLGRCFGCPGRSHQGLVHQVYAAIGENTVLGEEAAIAMFPACIEMLLALQSVRVGGLAHVTADGGGWARRNERRGPLAIDMVQSDLCIVIVGHTDDIERARNYWQGERKQRVAVIRAPRTHWPRIFNIWRRMAFLLAPMDVTVVVTNARIENAFIATANWARRLRTAGFVVTATHGMITPAPGGFSVGLAVVPPRALAVKFLQWIGSHGHIYGTDDLGTASHFPTLTFDPTPYGSSRLGSSVAEQREIPYMGVHYAAWLTAAGRVRTARVEQYTVYKAALHRREVASLFARVARRISYALPIRLTDLDMNFGSSPAGVPLSSMRPVRVVPAATPFAALLLTNEHCPGLDLNTQVVASTSAEAIGTPEVVLLYTLRRPGRLWGIVTALAYMVSTNVKPLNSENPKAKSWFSRAIPERVATTLWGVMLLVIMAITQGLTSVSYSALSTIQLGLRSTLVRLIAFVVFLVWPAMSSGVREKMSLAMRYGRDQVIVQPRNAFLFGYCIWMRPGLLGITWFVGCRSLVTLLLAFTVTAHAMYTLGRAGTSSRLAKLGKGETLLIIRKSHTTGWRPWAHLELYQPEKQLVFAVRSRHYHKGRLLGWTIDSSVAVNGYTVLGYVPTPLVQWAAGEVNCFQITLGRSGVRLTTTRAYFIVLGAVFSGLMITSTPVILALLLPMVIVAWHPLLQPSFGLLVYAVLALCGLLQVPGVGGKPDWAWWRRWANDDPLPAVPPRADPLPWTTRLHLRLRAKRLWRQASAEGLDHARWRQRGREESLEVARRFGIAGREYFRGHVGSFGMLRGLPNPLRDPLERDQRLEALETAMQGHHAGSPEWRKVLEQAVVADPDLNWHTHSPLLTVAATGDLNARPATLPVEWTKGSHTTCKSRGAVGRVLRDGPHLRGGRARFMLPPEGATAVEIWAACPSIARGLPPRGKAQYTSLRDSEQCAYLWRATISTKRAGADIRTDAFHALAATVLDDTPGSEGSYGHKWLAYVVGLRDQGSLVAARNWRDQAAMGVGSPLAHGSPAAFLGMLVAKHVALGHDWEISLEAAVSAWADVVAVQGCKTNELIDTIASHDLKEARASHRKNKVLARVYSLTAWTRAKAVNCWIANVAVTILGLLTVALQTVVSLADMLFRACCVLLLATSLVSSVERIHDMWGRILSVFGVTARTSLKTVWAPLFQRRREYLSKEDELGLLIGSAKSNLVPNGTDDDPNDAIIRAFSRFGMENLLNLSDIILSPVRKMFIPSRARMAPHEEDMAHPSLRPTLINEDGVVDERAARLISAHGNKGLDGTWHSTDARVLESVSRYEIHPDKPTAQSRAFLFEAIDALEERDPERFRNWGVTRPEALKNYIKMRYSPGWPFIGSYKSRAELWESGWGDAIATAARQFLLEGEYPNMNFHAFTKMQVVNGERIREQPDGSFAKSVRTVVAQDLTTSFMDFSLFLERSKRPLSDKSSAVLGVSLNQPGLLSHFEAIARRRRGIGFDAVEHDSRLSAVLMEGLAEQARRGHAHRANPALDRLVRQRYSRIQKASIHVLQTGSTVQKLRGGATGQTRTTDDNTEGLEMAVIAAWSSLTGKRASEFWNTMTLRVAGDNGMLGTDDDTFSFEDWAVELKFLYGIEMKLDHYAQGEAMEFLSKLAVPGARYAEAFKSRGMAVPTFAVVHDPKRLALRRSGMTSRLASAPLGEHLMGRMLRSQGHAMLLAHQEEFYDTIAKDWIEDATLLLRLAPGECAFTVGYDADGYIMSVELRGDWVPSSEHARQKSRWIAKKGKLPSYDDVFRVHTNPQKAGRPISRHKKVLDLRGSHPKAFMFSVKMERAARKFRKFAPSWIARVMADRSIRPIGISVASSDYRLERWTWTMIHEQKGRDPVTWEDWSAVARISPFAGVMDMVGFREWMDKEGGAEQLILDTPDSLGGFAIILVACYILVNLVMRAPSRSSPAGMALTLFAIYAVDLIRLYSLLALLYYLGTATSSAAISALVPRDPYWILKRISHLMASLFPDAVVAAVPWRLMTRWLPGLAKFLAEMRLTWPGQRKAAELLALVRRPVWERAADEVVRSWGTPLVVKYVIAQTATGKSTEFIACLKAICGTQVWLILPSRYARDTYGNPWASSVIQRLAKGSRPHVSAGIVVMTYGQFLAHAGLARQNRPWVVMDEMHIAAPEQIEAERVAGDLHRVFTSATPRLGYYPRPGRNLSVAVSRGGKARREVRNLRIAGLAQLALAEAKRLDSRVVLLVVGQQEAMELADALTKGGHPAAAITRLSREAPPDLHLVGTAVVSTGVNIRPPPRVGATSGMELVSDRGRMVLQHTSAPTDKQQFGRFGRDGPGTFFSPPWAGTGKTPVTYPNWRLYTSSLPSYQNFNSVLQISHRLDQCNDRPRRRVGVGADLSEVSTAIVASPAVMASLKAVYPFLTVSKCAAEALRNYALWRLTGVLSTGCEQLAVQMADMNRYTALGHAAMVVLVESKPYSIKIDNVTVMHGGLKLLGSSVVALPWETR